MVEHAVQYELHASAVDLGAEGLEPRVAGFQVVGVGGARPVERRVGVVRVPILQHIPRFHGNQRQVRVYVVVVLGVVFVGRRR